MIALDTNLLVHAHRAAAPEHRGARTAIAFEGGARELWSHDANFITVAGLRLVNPLK